MSGRILPMWNRDGRLAAPLWILWVFTFGALGPLFGQSVSSCPYEETTTASHISFVHQQGIRPLGLPQTMGPGVAFVDLDLDGYPDLVFVQGSGKKDVGPTSDPIPHVEYYRNNGDGTFTEASQSAGLAISGWGMG